MNQTPQSKRKNLADLAAFVSVAEEASFTRAAARLGLSQSALSHTIKQLEARLGMRLLARTTRSVGLTAAGERLLAQLRPALDGIDQAMAQMGEMREAITGTLRITTFKLAASQVLWPVLPGFLRRHPGVQVETQISDQTIDIVADRFDAGIRFVNAVDKDMVGVPVGPALRLITVAAPEYLREHGLPQTPLDLVSHRCLHFRLSSSGEIFPWRFKLGGRSRVLKVSGPLVSNDNDSLLDAAAQGLGLARVYEALAKPLLDSGRLQHVLPAWSLLGSRLMLYHPSRRQVPPALQALITALREQDWEALSPGPRGKPSR